jgi:hypothetical protein
MSINKGKYYNKETGNKVMVIQIFPMDKEVLFVNEYGIEVRVDLKEFAETYQRHMIRKKDKEK